MHVPKGVGCSLHIYKSRVEILGLNTIVNMFGPILRVGVRNILELEAAPRLGRGPEWSFYLAGVSGVHCLMSIAVVFVFTLR